MNTNIRTLNRILLAGVFFVTALLSSAASEQAGAMDEKRFQEQLGFLHQLDFRKINAYQLLGEVEARLLANPAHHQLAEARGILHYALQDHKKAVQELSALGYLQPVANRVLALACWELKDYKSAEKYFNAIPKITISRSDWEKYCQVLAANKKREAAAAEYEYFLLKFPDSKEAVLYLISFYKEPLQKDRLILKLRHAMKHLPREHMPWLEMARLTDNSQPGAIEYREKYLTLNPVDIEVLDETAALYAEKRQIKKALEKYGQIIKLKPSQPEFRIKTGKLLAGVGRHKEAAAYFQAALDMGVQDKETALALGTALMQAGQTRNGIEMLIRVLGENPGDKQVLVDILTGVRQLKIQEEKKDILFRMEMMAPESREVQALLAECYLAQGDRESAYSYAAKAAGSGAYEDLSRLSRTITTDEQIGAHFKILERLAGSGDADADLSLLLARGYFNARNLKQSGKYFHDVYVKDPARLKTSRAAAVSAYKTERFEMAAAISKSFLRETGSDIEILEIQIRSYEKTGVSGPELRQALGQYLYEKPESDNWWLKKAELDLEAKDTLSAIENARIRIGKNPDGKDAHIFILPLVENRAGYHDLYMTSLEALARLDKGSESSYRLRMGFALIGQLDYQRAREELRGVSDRFPGDHRMWFALGRCEQELYMEGAGEKYFAKAYAAKPNDPASARAFGRFLQSDKALEKNLDLFRLLEKNQPVLEEKIKLAVSYFLNGQYAPSAAAWDAVSNEDRHAAVSNPRCADAYLKAGLKEKAMAILEARHGEEPYDIKILSQLAALYLDQSMSDTYLETLRKMRDIDPDHEKVQLVLARELKLQAKVRESLEAFESWAIRHPDDREALQDFYSLCAAEKDTMRLMQSLEMITALKPAETKYHCQLAELRYVRMGDIQDLERLVKENPDYNSGRKILVTHYFTNGYIEQLKPFLAFMKAQAGRDQALLGPLSEYCIHSGDIAGAHEYLYQRLCAFPGNREIFDRTHLFALENKSPHLKNILETGARSFGKDINIKMELAELLGATVEALELYKEVLAIDPSRLDAAKTGAGIALGSGRIPDALKLLTRWTELSPADTAPYLELSLIFDSTGKLNERARVQESLVRIAPENAAFYVDLAGTYHRMQARDKAMSAYSRGLAALPTAKNIQQAVLAFLEKDGSRDVYMNACAHIQGIDPDAHDVQFRLAGLYIEKRDLENAYRFLDKALYTQPENAQYQALLPRVITRDDQIIRYYDILQALAAKTGAEADVRCLAALGRSLNGETETAAKMFKQLYDGGSADILKGRRRPVTDLFGAQHFQAAGALAGQYLNQVDLNDREIREIQVKSFVQSNIGGEPLRKAINALVKMDPVSDDWWFKLAGLDLAAQDTAAAVEHACRWLDTRPDDIQACRFLLPLVEKNPSEKETYARVLDQLTRLHPEKAEDYHLALGFLHFRENRFLPAAEHLTRASEKFGKNAELWHVLGKAEMAMNEKEMGAAHLLQATKLDPDRASYARAWAATLETDEALVSGIHALEFLNRSGPSLEERKKLARALYLKEQYQQSASLWQEILKTSPALGETESGIAEAFLKSGRNREALSLFSARHSREPGDLKVMEMMARLQLEFGEEKQYVVTLEKIVGAEPELGDYQKRLAQAYDKSGIDLSAIRHYEKWIGRNHKDREALTALLRLVKARKDTLRTIETLRLLTLNENAGAEYRFELAELSFLTTGDISGLEELTAKFPDYRQGRILLAGYWHAGGDNARAKALLLEACERRKFDAEAAWNLYRIHASEKNNGESRHWLETLIRSDSPRSEYVYPLAALEMNAGKYDAAAKLLEMPEIRPGLDAEHSFMLLKCYLQSDEMNKLSPLAFSIEQQFPAEAGVSEDLALIYYRQKNFGKAEDILRKINTGNSSGAARYLSGKIAFDRENWAAAADHFQNAGTVRSDVMIHLGQCFSRLGRKAEAIEALEKQYALDGSMKSLELAVPLYREMKDTYGASRALERLVEKDPDNQENSVLLAEMYDSLRQPEKSSSILQSILKKNPMHPAANLYLGRAHAARGEYKKAAGMLNIGLKTYSKDWEAWNSLAECQLRLDKKRKALDAYQKSFEINDAGLTAAAGKLGLLKELGKPAELTKAYMDVVRLDSNHAEAALAVAHVRYDEGKLQKAAELYRLAAKHITEDKLLWTRYGMSLLKTGKPEEAGKALSAAVQLGENRAAVTIRLAEVHVELGELQEAEHILNAILKNYPQDHYALFLLGRVAQKSSQLDMAEDLLKKAVKGDPSVTAYYEALAAVYYEEGKAEEAEKTLSAVKSSLSREGSILLARCLRDLGEYAQALSLLETICKISAAAPLHFQMAEIYMDMNSPDGAIKLIEKSEFGKDPAIRTIAAKARARKGQYEKAQAIAESLIREEPDSPEHHFLRGQVYFEEARYKQCIKELETAGELRADYPEALFLQGRASLRMDKPGKAADAFGELTRHRSTTWKARGQYGMALSARQKGDREAAAAFLRQSLEQEFSNDAALLLVQLLSQMKQSQEAEAVLQNAMKQDKKDPRIIAARAEVLLAQGKNSDAFRLLKKSLENHPQSCELLHAFNKTNWWMGNYDDVRSNSKETLKACPDMPESHLYLGYVNFKVYDKKAAKKNFKRFVKMGGDRDLLPEDY